MTKYEVKKFVTSEIDPDRVVVQINKFLENAKIEIVSINFVVLHAAVSGLGFLNAFVCYKYES